MNERSIELQDLNTKDFFGTNNMNFDELKKYFPKIKLVARGNHVFVFGEAALLDAFEKSLNQLIDYFHKYNKMDANIIEQIVTSAENKDHKKHSDTIVHGVGGRFIKAQTVNQQKMVDEIEKNDMLFAIGPAGSGKTYTAVALAVRALKEREVRRIILTRPAVESGENLGFLPGDIKEKLDPYMQPLYDALQDMIPYEKLESYLEKGIIQIAPLAFMRGRTLDSAFVILDEAQNTTHNQMKMFLTRMGRNAKFIITGDPGQVDLPARQVSGLKEAIINLSNIEGISFVQLDNRDIIRHKLVGKILDAFKRIDDDQ